MANESIHMPVDQNLDYQLVAHIVEGLKKEQKTVMPYNARLKMHTELRMLTFWRWVGVEFVGMGDEIHESEKWRSWKIHWWSSKSSSFTRKLQFSERLPIQTFLSPQSDYLRVHGVVPLRVHRLRSSCWRRHRRLSLIRFVDNLAGFGTFHCRSYALLHPHLR
jgi:hypothetical protein